MPAFEGVPHAHFRVSVPHPIPKADMADLLSEQLQYETASEHEDDDDGNAFTNETNEYSGEHVEASDEEA